MRISEFLCESKRVEKLKEDSLRLFELKDNFQEYESKATKIAAKVGRSEGCVFQKCKRLVLGVIISKRRQKIITHAIKLPKELPSVEEALKIYAGAIKRR